MDENESKEDDDKRTNRESSVVELVRERAERAYWELVREWRFRLLPPIHRNVEIPRDQYGALMGEIIPDAEDWIKFGRDHLSIDDNRLTLAQEIFHGDALKKEILQLWIAYTDGETTVSGAYKLANDFVKDEKKKQEDKKKHAAKKKEKHQPDKTSWDILISSDNFGGLMDKYISDPEDWITFGRKYLRVGDDLLAKAREKYRGDDLKKAILKQWITSNGDEATVSRAYELAYDFITDELEEVFRFLIRLITDAKEWKSFAKHGLKLDITVYREHGHEITRDQQLKMLRMWRENEGSNASVERLCDALRTHFAGKSTLFNICTAVMNPRYEAISSGLEKLRKAVENLSFSFHTEDTKTQSAFIGCINTTIHTGT